MRVENIETFNWEGAIKGMRNPLKSWDKSDSMWKSELEGRNIAQRYVLGNNDKELYRPIRTPYRSHYYSWNMDRTGYWSI